MASRSEAYRTREYDYEAMNKAILQQLWSAMNLADKLYWIWFLGIAVVIAVLPHRVEHWERYVLLHAVALCGVSLVALHGDRNHRWRFAHDWLPLLLFVVVFGETAALSFLFRDAWQDWMLLAMEGRVFGTPPTVWLGKFGSNWWLTELMEFGYLSYYGFQVAVAGVLYAHAYMERVPVERRMEARRGFRNYMDAMAAGYIICYLFYLLLPTEGPARTLAHLHGELPLSGGPFHWMVNLVQSQAGVHGNAFPSAHIMSATIAAAFAWKYARRLAMWLTPLLVLMCMGAVYDRYHYVSDVVGGLLVAAMVCGVFVAKGRQRKRGET